MRISVTSLVAAIGITVCIAAIIIMTYAWQTWPHAGQATRHEVRTGQSAVYATPPGVRNPAFRPLQSEVSPKPPTSGSVDYRTAFRTSKNYWRLAHDVLLPQARAGNADAQFYLSQALTRCASANNALFRRHGKTVSLDEARTEAGKQGLLADYADSVFERCHEFLDRDPSDMGSALAWLSAAADARQPGAQAMIADNILVQDVIHRIAVSAQVPDANADHRVSSATPPRELLREAAATGNPEALLAMGDAADLLAPAKSAIDRYAWTLLACRAGLDCSPLADWAALACAGSHAQECATATSADDLIQILSGAAWSEVQDRAQEMSVAVDAGDWDTLGFGG